MPFYCLPRVAKKPEKPFETSKGASELECKETTRPGVKSLPETVRKHDLLPRELWVPDPTAAWLAMYWLKMCPRCRGDLYEEEDRLGRHLTCLQCGRSQDIDPYIALGVVTTGESSSRWKHAIIKE